MAKWLSFVDSIAILPTHSFSFDETFSLQVMDDPLNCPFRDPYLIGDFPEHFFRIGMQNGQHVSVIRQERPTVRTLAGLRGVRTLEFAFPSGGLSAHRTDIR